MTAFPRLALAMLMAAALAGCGASTPLRYHALSAGSAATLTQGSAAMLVEVLPVAVPERVNREEIVLVGAGGQLDVRSGDRWAAPLSDEMRQMVDDALWRRLRAADIYAAPVTPTANGLPQYRLALRMERLEASAGRQAVAEATWTIRRLPQGQPAICRAGAAEGVAAATPDAAVAGLSRAASRVAEAVAASLERLQAGAANPCEG
ncbi:MAG: membrane integrity-associated transporter subunit PqiC [Bacteroidales bacterium]